VRQGHALPKYAKPLLQPHSASPQFPRPPLLASQRGDPPSSNPCKTAKTLHLCSKSESPRLLAAGKSHTSR
jgi:hypothetical protein